MENFTALFERMRRMPDQIDQAHFRKRYRGVAHIAHGWLQRVSRGGQALVLLHESGFDGEAPPLARSVLEHFVALRWLVGVGGDITAPLRSVHGRETAKFLEALRKTSRTGPNEDEFAKVLASTEHDDHGRDHFHAFAHRVLHHGRDEDVTAYQGLVMESHATYQSAVQYWDPEEGERLETSRAEFDWPQFAACYMYRALVAYASIFIAPPWRQELDALKRKLIDLEPDLEGSLDD